MESELLIHGIYVPTYILGIKFKCDIAKCYGGCCYSDDKEVVGPPLSQAEATAIRHTKAYLARYVDNPKQRSIAVTHPIYTDGKRLPFRLRLLDSRCIYCNTNGCALKVAHFHNPVLPDQPISCELYPICEGWDPEDKKPFIFIEHYFDDILCKYGYELGKKEGVYLIDFLRSPLVRRFGWEFYDALKQAQRKYLEEND